MEFDKVQGQQKAPFFLHQLKVWAHPQDICMCSYILDMDLTISSRIYIAKTWSSFISESEHSAAFRLRADNAKLCGVGSDL